jgi:ABC-type antimicrobial peptide transport system permease subunit
MRITQYPARITATTVTAFAAMALILALAGVFGLVSYAASQRTHEFGMRMALGAGERQILWQALRQGGLVCLAGAALGLPGAYAIAKFMSGLLVGVSATDPLVFILTPVFVLGAIVAACYVPARRAAHLDPAQALRYE